MGGTVRLADGMFCLVFQPSAWRPSGRTRGHVSLSSRAHKVLPSLGSVQAAIRNAPGATGGPYTNTCPARHTWEVRERSRSSSDIRKAGGLYSYSRQSLVFASPLICSSLPCARVFGEKHTYINGIRGEGSSSSSE